MRITDVQKYTCGYRYAFSHVANVDTLYVHVPASWQTKQNSCILQIITFCPLFRCVCVSKRGMLKLLYPYKSLPILFPLVLSPHISYQPPSSNSLYLPYCRSLSVFILLHLPPHLSFFTLLLFLSSPSPHICLPLFLSASFCKPSVYPIVIVISQIWEEEVGWKTKTTTKKKT